MDYLRVDVTKGIKVGGLDYRVDLSEAAGKHCNSENRLGTCTFTEQLIRVDASWGEQRTSGTFLHEVVEAVNEEYCEHKIDHEVISRLANGLHQVMESLGVRFGNGLSPG